MPYVTNQIIASYSNINDAITLKSKYHYPTQKHSFYTPTIIDQNATSLNKEPVFNLAIFMYFSK